MLRELRPLAPLNWSPVENLHITSKFIGRMAETTADGTRGSALTADQPPAAFDVQIARFGYFPNPHSPRALFRRRPRRARTGGARKADRRRASNRWASRAEDRPYAPHLTLARIKHENSPGSCAEHIAKMTNFDFGTFHVSEFHLYSSKTGPRGSVYATLATYPLPADSSGSRRVLGE